MPDWDPKRFYEEYDWKEDLRLLYRYERESCQEVSETDEEMQNAWKSPGDVLTDVLVDIGQRYVYGTECESPIELDFVVALKKQAKPGFEIQPQYKWKGWRMDFAILDKDEKIVAFVECDGAEFHSTPDQIANDRRKDAGAREACILLLRFTGREIYHDAPWCAASVWRAISG